VKSQVDVVRRACSTVVLLVGLGLVGACGREERAPAPLAAPTMTRAAWLEAVRQAHAGVDGAQSSDDKNDALRRIAVVLDEATPLPEASAAPVKQDLASRAARLALELGRADEARGWAERGLALGNGMPFFRANLLVELADAERMLGKNEAAREHLVQALGINQDLLDRELEEP